MRREIITILETSDYQLWRYEALKPLGWTSDFNVHVSGSKLGHKLVVI